MTTMSPERIAWGVLTNDAVLIHTGPIIALVFSASAVRLRQIRGNGLQAAAFIDYDQHAGEIEA
jgi:hypothetical protein